jgi:hypothetical protein
MVRDRQKISNANLYQMGAKESNGDVSFGPARPLGAEIDIPPIPTRENRLYRRSNTRYILNPRAGNGIFATFTGNEGGG